MTTSTANTAEMFDVRALLAAFRRTPPPPGDLGRGLRALEAGRFAEADAALAAAVAEASDRQARALAHNKRGVALVGLERRADALEQFAAALDADDAYAPALVNVGNLLLEDGQIQDAIDYYRAAIRADDGYAPAHRHLGIAYKRAGRRDAAVSALRAADRREGRPSRKRA